MKKIFILFFMALDILYGMEKTESPLKGLLNSVSRNNDSDNNSNKTYLETFEGLLQRRQYQNAHDFFKDNSTYFLKPLSIYRSLSLLDSAPITFHNKFLTKTIEEITSSHQHAFILLHVFKTEADIVSHYVKSQKVKDYLARSGILNDLFNSQKNLWKKKKSILLDAVINSYPLNTLRPQPYFTHTHTNNINNNSQIMNLSPRSPEKIKRVISKKDINSYPKIQTEYLSLYSILCQLHEIKNNNSTHCIQNYTLIKNYFKLSEEPNKTNNNNENDGDNESKKGPWRSDIIIELHDRYSELESHYYW